MATLIKVPTFSDGRGSLSVVEKFLPFDIKRFYYIYDVVGARGGHRHRVTRQALICVSGSCTIYVHDGQAEQSYMLDSSSLCLLLNPQDWHVMSEFSASATLLVFASEHYDVHDYIDERYP